VDYLVEHAGYMTGFSRCLQFVYYGFSRFWFLEGLHERRFVGMGKVGKV